MRDEKWLFEKLDEVWDKHFADVPQDNDVRIVWGRKARTRLGSIKQNQRLMTNDKRRDGHPETIITINQLFQDETIPEYVVIGTIAHELAHYTHGFNSPLEQKYETPHAGGIINIEMKERGLESILKNQKKWLKENWKNYILQNHPPKKRKVVIRWI